MILPNNLNPKIKEIIEGDSVFDDFYVQAHSGNGDWVGLLDMREWVYIDLTYKDNRVYAKASINIVGFSGVLESHEWCMPNNMLFRSIMQLLTIAEFLPREENINDHEWRLHSRWMRQSREKRAKALEKIRKQLQQDLGVYEDLLCLVEKYNLNPKNEVVVWVNKNKYIERAARVIYKETRSESD